MNMESPHLQGTFGAFSTVPGVTMMKYPNSHLFFKIAPAKGPNGKFPIIKMRASETKAVLASTTVQQCTSVAVGASKKSPTAMTKMDIECICNLNTPGVTACNWGIATQRAIAMDKTTLQQKIVFTSS